MQLSAARRERYAIGVIAAPTHAVPLCHACSWLKRARHVLQRLQPAFPDMRVSLGLGASEDLDAVDSVYVWVSGIPVGFQARFPTLLLGTSYQSTHCTAAPCECTCIYLGWGVHCLPPTLGAAAPRCPRCLAAPRTPPIIHALGVALHLAYELCTCVTSHMCRYGVFPIMAAVTAAFILALIALYVARWCSLVHACGGRRDQCLQALCTGSS
jgi:hypothetical protein